MSLPKVEADLKKSILRRALSGLCAPLARGLDCRVLSDARLLFCQNDGCSQRSCFFVLSPGRTKDTSHAINLFPDCARGLSKRFLRVVVEFTFANAGDGNSQALQHLPESMAEELAFCGMNQCM